MSEKTVFISYRRDATGKAFARSLEQALTQRGFDAFLDVDCMEAGKWVQQIRSQVPKRAHFLLVLTPHALDRCTAQDDWVRQEFELAVKSNRNIVPVSEESVAIAELQQTCPDCMNAVFDFQIQTMRHASFKNDIDSLLQRFIPRHKAAQTESASAPMTEASFISAVAKSPVECPAPSNTWRSVFKNWLIKDFVEEEHDFQGFFAAHHDPALSKRWQTQGGETIIRKRPYYETFWGYQGAFSAAPECVAKWRPLTVAAIERHFGEGRWLEVVRDYSFVAGPRARPSRAESVRHTARAADILRMLDPRHRRVSEVAWALLHESERIQNADGGWVEFRAPNEPSALWATIYVCRYLACLVSSPESGVVSERAKFVEKAKQLVSSAESMGKFTGLWEPS